MKILKHMIENPFIAGAGIAALAHSTWSLATLFSGEMPGISFASITIAITTVGQWLYWFIPGFLIAFALDVGQIDTSAKIRHEGLTVRRSVTFFVFAIATYYLQFLYIAHHMPSLVIESGISDFHRFAVTELRNAAIWILPAMLPLATLLYTMADKSPDRAKTTTDETYVDWAININTLEDTADALPLMDDEINLLPDAGHVVECEFCGWRKDGYSSERYANQALTMHQKSCELCEA